MLGTVNLLNFSQSSQYIAVSHCGFNSDFSMNYISLVMLSTFPYACRSFWKSSIVKGRFKSFFFNDYGILWVIFWVYAFIVMFFSQFVFYH